MDFGLKCIWSTFTHPTLPSLSADNPFQGRMIKKYGWKKGGRWVGHFSPIIKIAVFEYILISFYYFKIILFIFYSVIFFRPLIGSMGRLSPWPLALFIRVYFFHRMSICFSLPTFLRMGRVSQILRVDFVDQKNF